MRIARLELKDVGPFEDAVFEMPEPKGPGELVLFEGPNGSGKTTLLQIIAIAASGQWGSGTSGWAEAPREECGRRCRNSSELRVHVAPGHGLEPSVLYPGVSLSRGPLTDALVRYDSAVGDGRQAIEWAALAYAPAHPTASLVTDGPKDIHEPPLRGALAFGRKPVGSRDFGQLLTNLESERVRAAQYAQEQSSPDQELFPIRPDKDHKVRGKVEPRALEPGQSLEWVVTEIFQAAGGPVALWADTDGKWTGSSRSHFAAHYEIDVLSGTKKVGHVSCDTKGSSTSVCGSKVSVGSSHSGDCELKLDCQVPSIPAGPATLHVVGTVGAGTSDVKRMSINLREE